MTRYLLPDPCRLGVDSPANITQALAAQLAAGARRRSRSPQFAWHELASRLVGSTRTGPLTLDRSVGAEELLDLMLEVGTLVPPLARAGLLPSDRCAVWSACLLDSADPIFPIAAGAAWFRLEGDPARRWRPGWPRLTHPAFRPRHWWCAAELLRRCLLAKVLPHLHEQPQVLPYGDGVSAFERVRLFDILDLQVRPVEREFRIRNPVHKNGPLAAAATLSVSHPLPGSTWLIHLVERHCGRQLKELARAASGPTDIGDDETCEEAAAVALRTWLLAWLRREAQRSGLLPGLRRRLQRALRLQRSTWSLAWRLLPNGRRFLSAADYQSAWRHEQTLAVLQAEAPGTFPLYAALAVELELAPAAGYHGLLDALRARGLSHGGRTLLAHHGSRILRSLRPAIADEPGRADALVAMANLIVATQRIGLPPAPLLRALARARLHRLHEPRERVPIVMLRAAWEACLDDARSTSTVAAEFDQLLQHWSLDRWSPGALPSGLRWRWFQRQLERVQQALVVAPWLDASWPAPLSTYRCGDLVAHALTDGRSVYEEALAMRHCLGLPGYLEACQSGRACAYSIREARTGRRRWTALLAVGFAGWGLHEMAGFANAAATAQARRFGECLLDAHRAAAGEPPRRGARRSCPPTAHATT